MIELDYGTQLSPSDIKLSIGTLRKPKLRDIAELTFDKFSYFELLAKLTPEQYYKDILGKQGTDKWNSMSDDDRERLSIYEMIDTDKVLMNSYIELFNFFFVENVIYKDKLFVLVNHSIDRLDDIDVEDVTGVISEDTFIQVLDLIQQICCIRSKDDKPIEKLKFKNKTAKKWFDKIRKAEKQNSKSRGTNKDYTLPNIISAVSSKHPSINLLNVYDLTIFQLIDTFNRLQYNSIYDIESRRVSVWGDEKKTFDPSFWYKNKFT